MLWYVSNIYQFVFFILFLLLPTMYNFGFSFTFNHYFVATLFILQYFQWGGAGSGFINSEFMWWFHNGYVIPDQIN